MDVGFFEKYGGQVDIEAMEAGWGDLHAYIAELQAELGDFSFSLNIYVYAMMEALSISINASEAAVDAFDRGLGDLYAIARHLRDNDSPEMEAHPFFSTAKEHAAKFPVVPGQLYVSRLVPGLFHRYAKYALHEYERDCEARLQDSMDKAGVSAKREKLLNRLHEDKLRRLDDLLFRHHYALSPSRVYMQGLLDSLLFPLISVFEDTGDIEI
ncbi:hypothetical protein LJC74_06865 [Eubacteriales bacterium OttesenSCG-928-A19]|nr:hypothetical protein [Eubacteriales bacterium OttesenSCG-928-A19]